MKADGEHLKADGDAFRVLGWGLQRYAWLVGVFVLGFGLLVPAMLSRVPDQFDAQAQVGPVEPLNLPNLDPLPRLGESVFGNGAVAEEVRQSFTPPLPATANVVPERVELVAAQDNIVFTIVGHGSTPESAARVANVAAARFTEELRKYTASVGGFSIQRLADTPTRPTPTVGGPLAVGLGVLAGLIGGVGAVSLLLVWRRPITHPGSAAEVAGAPVFARIRVDTARGNIRGLPQLCHRLRSSPADMLLLTGSGRTKRERRLLAAELTEVLGCVQKDLVIIDGPSQMQAATRPENSVTLLVAREGIAATSLHRQAEQFLDGGHAGVVLVRRAPLSWLRRLWKRPRSARRTAKSGAVQPQTSTSEQHAQRVDSTASH